MLAHRNPLSVLFVILLRLPPCYLCCYADSVQNSDQILYSIQTGENSFKHANGLEIYEYFEQNQKEAQIFNSAMTSITSSQDSLISPMYDFSQFNTIIDIGGGQGIFLSTILKNNPNLHGILFDLPQCMYVDNNCIYYS